MLKKISFIGITLALAGIGLFMQTDSASAVTGANWRAGHIIDDAVFTSKDYMSPEMIQQFLEAKMPSCDINGSKSVYDSAYGDTVSRHTYGSRRGNPSPFTCIKYYYEVPKVVPGPEIPANNYGGKAIPPGSRSAAQLIWDAAQAYNINPAVLLVTLQKEQALITDDWPFSRQYLYAMGANCPDSGPGGSANCDTNYAGFSLQMREGAELLRYYLDNMNQSWWSYKKPGNNYILWNVQNTGCGGGNVFIETKATAALYTYTPYQPNQAALNNLYGTGDGCSAYGNRNFWRIFHDWFSSPYRLNGTINLSQGLTVSGAATKYVGDTITATYEVENTATYDVYVGGLGVCGRLNGQYYDLGFIHHNAIAANSKKTISFTKTLDTAGSLTVFMCSYYEGIGGWASDRYPYDPTNSMSRQITVGVADNPVISSGIALGPANPGIHQTVNAYVTLTNARSVDVNIGSMVVAARDPFGNNVDFPLKNDVIIPANTTQTFVWSRVFTTPGKYSFYIANWNGVWRTDYPKSSSGTIIRQLNWPILDNPLISSGIAVTTPSPTSGQPVDATITFRNTSSSDINIGSVVIAARNSTGGNVDFPLKNDVIIPANDTKTFTWTRTFSSPGAYSLFVANWNGVWTTSYPKSMNESVQRQMTLTVN